jgi:hypothetical protein
MDSEKPEQFHVKLESTRAVICHALLENDASDLTF